MTGATSGVDTSYSSGAHPCL